MQEDLRIVRLERTSPRQNRRPRPPLPHERQPSAPVVPRRKAASTPASMAGATAPVSSPRPPAGRQYAAAKSHHLHDAPESGRTKDTHQKEEVTSTSSRAAHLATAPHLRMKPKQAAPRKAAPGASPRRAGPRHNNTPARHSCCEAGCWSGGSRRIPSQNRESTSAKTTARAVDIQHVAAHHRKVHGLPQSRSVVILSYPSRSCASAFAKQSPTRSEGR